MTPLRQRLAKRLREADAESTAAMLQTQAGAVLGTPSYMAPEQAAGRAEMVGPAVDVYALGAVLYEALTGRPPFRAATVLETLEQVRSQEPVAPTRLQPGLPRDLETICLQCLRKEPARRYASAEALAEDLRRFQASEPILARPTSSWKRAWKWMRRHPAAAALLAVSAAAIVLLLAGGLYFTRQLQQEREKAVGQAAAAERARKEERRERDRAEENFALALEAVEKYLTKVGESPELRAHALEPLRRDLLESAREFYERFVQKRAKDLGLHARLGKAYNRLASVTYELGDTKKAIEICGQARGIFTRLVIEQPLLAEHQADWRPSSNADLLQDQLADRSFAGIRFRNSKGSFGRGPSPFLGRPPLLILPGGVLARRMTERRDRRTLCFCR
jgi:eukaryotic-like serine/threonine-protein kinase